LRRAAPGAKRALELRSVSSDEADILTQATSWKRSGRGVAIATVVETWGSAPRPVGSHLAINDEGVFLGSVSGGCVEGDVVTAALDVIEDDAPQLLDFGVADETAWRVGLTCGGRIRVFVEKLDPAGLELLVVLNAERAARRTCVLVTALDDGEHKLIRPDDISACDALAAMAKERVRTRASGIVEQQGRRFFIEVVTPPTRLILIGAVHVAQVLAPMAQFAGFDVVVVDPRMAFSAKERFPHARVLSQWPDVALPSLGLDPFTAVATLTHDPKIDDLALRLALASDCFYVGALGSKKTHVRRVERMVASGVEPAALARLHAPIGLGIGALSPAEIAVAVLGEIILSLRQPREREQQRFSGDQRKSVCVN
jgi:xanthine dehydrogenase accessory factor